MWVIKVIEFMVIALCLWVLLAQLAWPLIKGRRPFPAFRPQKQRRLEQKFEAHEILDDATSLKEIGDILNQAEKMKKKIVPPSGHNGTIH
jgi:hypothetical protein